MIFDNLDSSLKFDLKNTSKDAVTEPEEYKEILSPYSRIFYIEEGAGYLYYNNERIELEPGYLYLIPSFVFCTYIFNPGLIIYYIHFVNSLDSGFNLYDLFYCSVKIKARELDIALLDELLHIHPNLKLLHKDPEVYQKKPWIHKEPEYDLFSDYLETNSIIGQLISRFICSSKKISGKTLTQTELLKPILAFIYENLHTEIKITELANMAAISKDHFTRVFKSVLKVAPNEYINRKRIEKAQTLLVTTGLSQKEIMVKCGFNSVSYFSRMFTKFTKLSPGEFRHSLV